MLQTYEASRVTLARVVQYFEEDLIAKGLPIKNLTVGKNGHYKIVSQHEEAVREIYEDIVGTVFDANVNGEPELDYSVFRAYLDDSRHGVTGQLQAVMQILDILVPRHREVAKTPDEYHVVPFDRDVVFTTNEATQSFLQENSDYIRRKIQSVCQRTNLSIPELGTPEELADMRRAEEDWLFGNNQEESFNIAKALNVPQKELQKLDLGPRFSYIARVLPAIQEISKTTPNGSNPAMLFVTGAGNVLMRFMGSTATKELNTNDPKEGEVIDLFNACHYFRHSLGHHREMATSILLRINNGKPAYTDIINLVSRYRGLHMWGLENLVRRLVPIMGEMYNNSYCRDEVVSWLDSCEILHRYQENKKFYFKI